MPKSIFKLIFALFVVLLVSCAKRGSLSGGDKDITPPVLETSTPKNYSTNFNANQIKLVFSEYVKLKNLSKQLIISPPMKYQPDIQPQNASKTLTIKLKDTLKPNTTYSFDFGQSIEDNNEGNPFSQFKYVFSTGNFIDSLSLKVNVKDALNQKTDDFVSVMLYEINEKFNDSTIYKNPPTYITNTLENAKTVTLENLKAGKYLLVALKDNGNNKFDPQTDKIGFQKTHITIPNDTVFEVELFKELLPFKALNTTQVSNNRMVMGYQGAVKNAKITVQNGTETIPSLITQMPKKDSLQIWFKPLKTDSLKVSVIKDKIIKNFTVKITKQKQDSLNITPEFGDNLPLRDRFALNSTSPLVKFDKSKIVLRNKDSIVVPFETAYDEFNQKLYLDFNKEPLEKYKITLLPGAVIDFYDRTNDSVSYKIKTKNISDYGNLKVILENVKRFPVIVELTDKDGKVKATEYSEKNTVIEFLSLEPALYSLRIIYDDNRNGVWDTGSFMEKRQSEEVIYFSKELDIRANWDVEQPFTLPE